MLIWPPAPPAVGTQTQTNTPRTEEGCVRELEKWDVPVVPPRRSSCTDRRSRVLLIVSWLACPALDVTAPNVAHIVTIRIRIIAQAATNLLEANYAARPWGHVHLNELDRQARTST